MNDIDRARAMFPLMPDEVFDVWIGEIIATHGWPFDSVDASIEFDYWPGFFLGLSLADWANAIWTKHALEQSAIRLAPQCAQLIMNVGTHAQCGFPVVIGAHVSENASRVDAHRAFIVREKRFPGFITGLDVGDGVLDLADGFHRMAALWSSGIRNLQIPAWIAKLD